MHNWDGLTTPALHREKQHTGTVGLVSSFPDYSGKAKVRTASCCSYEIPCVSVVQIQLSKSELADFSHFVVTVYSLVFLTWAPDLHLHLRAYWSRLPKGITKTFHAGTGDTCLWEPPVFLTCVPKLSQRRLLGRLSKACHSLLELYLGSEHLRVLLFCLQRGTSQVPGVGEGGKGQLPAMPAAVSCFVFKLPLQEFTSVPHPDIP